MPKSLWVRLGLALGACLLLSLLAAILAARSYVHEQSSGNMRLAWDGLYIQSKDFELPDSSRLVKVFGMIHVADQGYFHSLLATLSEDEDLVVLLEGIDDGERLAGAALDYSSLADRLGLVRQKPAFDRPIKTRFAYRYADARASDLSPEARRYLTLLGSADSMEKSYRLLTSDGFDPREWDLAESRFQTEREAKLFREFDEATKSFRTIAISWGVLHMPHIQEGLEQRGYRLKASQERLAIGFWGSSDARDQSIQGAP